MTAPPRPIDRAALVRRHHPTVHSLDPFAAFTVGNGEFAFTADVTGLQTFPEVYRTKFPLGTHAHWGWHSYPLPQEQEGKVLTPEEYDVHSRPVPYFTRKTGQESLFDYRRQNPHRLHLGQIGLELIRANGSPAAPDDLHEITQTLDLWTGILYSRFTFQGSPVAVRTCCHPQSDLVAVRIESPLIASGRLRLRLAFPYGSPNMDAADWQRPERHQTILAREGANAAAFARHLDSDAYTARAAWSDNAALTETAPHTFRLTGTGTALEFCCAFAPSSSATNALPTFARTEAASQRHWEQFWSTDGILDLGDSTDPRAPELERRIVLSLYNTALHCAGSLPSAETGLLCNSWYGKFHLEMHWWHSVHFVPWNRFPRFERSLALYHRILPIARDLARLQGYKGARWPKMIGPDGYDSPSPVGPLLIWQQPHPIYYAELSWRHAPTRETLLAWQDIVFASADFMASYAFFDPARKQYVLGPPLKTVSENQEARTTCNPAFELAYWRFGLHVAQTWRERLGLSRDPEWERVLQGLAPLPVKDGLYLLQEGADDTYTRWNWEHPALIGPYGMQPGDGVDRDTMHRTLRQVMKTWLWDKKSWGWDFPMTAMAAARVGEPALAVDALLLDVPKNHYLPNGHNYQREDLPAYLPANGGLLAAVAMMAAGWNDGPTHHAPGFPVDGRWSVRWENLLPWL